MTNIYMLLLMSASGTIMYILSSICGKKIKHYIWQYAMLSASVIMLLVPIQKILEIPRLLKVTVPQTINIGDMYTTQNVAQVSISAIDIITVLWLIVMIIFAVRMVFKYIKTSLTLKQVTEDCYKSKVLDIYFNVCLKMSVRRNIMLRSSKYLNSPLLFGIFKPTIIIPDTAFSESELEMILTHELTHYKHRDLWIALATSIAQCVHWFNPVVYFIGKSVTEVCELFCDETVVKHLGSADKKAYGNLILSVIEKELNSRLVYTTSMASAYDSIQKRLHKIAEFKIPTKASTIAGIMAVFACIVSSLTAFGFETVTETIPEEIKHIIPIATPTPKPTIEPTSKPTTISEQYTEENTKIQEAINISVHTESEASPEIKASSEPKKYMQVKEITQTPAETETEEIEATNPPITSYIFNADFSENTEIQSEVFCAKNGTKLSIRKVNGSKDVSISVNNAATGEAIYDEREDKLHDMVSMSLPKDGEYYVTAYSENGNSSGIYIYGE